MVNWMLFILLATTGYVCISIFGRLVGPESTSFLKAVMTTFKPLPLSVVMIGNMLLGGALYYGFLSTSFAITIAIAIGVVTSFVYSSIVFGITITLIKVIGVLMILIGIYLLR